MREQTWALKEGHVMRKGGQTALKLSDVHTVTWADVTLRGTRSAGLHLKSDEQSVKITCSESGGGRGGFLAFASDICEALGEAAPDAQLRIDEGAGFSMAIFVIGLVGLGLGLFCALAGGLGWIAEGGTQYLLGGLVSIGVFGFLAFKFAPGQQVTSLSATQLAAKIRAS